MLILYKTGKQFLQCNELIFRSYPLETLLFFNVAQRMADESEGFVVKVTDGPVFLIAIQYMDLPMILCGDKSLCSELAIGLFENGLTFGRVLAEQDLAESFSRAYRRFAGGTYHAARAIDIMLCRQLKEINTDAVEPALPEDAKEISGLLTKFNKEALQPLGDVKQTIRSIKTEIGRFALIREDGRIVSIARKGEETKSVCGISGLYTVEGYRGRGLAKKVAAYLTQSIVQQKKIAHVFVNQQDAAAHQFYQRIGYIQGIPQIENQILVD